METMKIIRRGKEVGTISLETERRQISSKGRPCRKADIQIRLADGLYRLRNVLYLATSGEQSGETRTYEDVRG